MKSQLKSQLKETKLAVPPQSHYSYSIMKVTPNIKEYIAESIQDGNTDANDILTNLIEFGIVDEEYELYDEDGEFDAKRDELVQEYIKLEIKRQLKR